MGWDFRFLLGSSLFVAIIPAFGHPYLLFKKVLETKEEKGQKLTDTYYTKPEKVIILGHKSNWKL